MCIIATISPSVHSLEETLSTLDYAHRAKNIKNKPEINQKMKKSAVIKDLYSEMDRLKQELYAAREKNGIYIPRDRYLQDEAEKKKLLEVQELYNSQQQLNVELSHKLENRKKRLQETENALLDLEERYRQANERVKVKEYLISGLLKSEKAPSDRALELRADLETATSDISNLFAKIDRKDKIEDGNRALVQKFQSQLTQQLDILHKAVASSTTQQEQQLKEMEEDVHSFVSTKTEATEELRSHLEMLKTMYGSGVNALDDLAREFDGKSQLTFAHLNSEVSKNSLALEELCRGITSEANALLHDLQDSLHSQESKLTSYAQQQREAHSRSRSISRSTVDFFKNFDGHASKLGRIVEEAQVKNEHKLSELEKKFKECAAFEERQLLASVAELVEGSNARKQNLVHCEIDGIRQSMARRTNKLQQEMSTMQGIISSVKAEWLNYTQGDESRYLEDTASVENRKENMEGVLHKCLERASLGKQQWNNAQNSIRSLEKRNTSSIDEIVRCGKDTIEVFRGRLSSAMNLALEDWNNGSKNVLLSIERSLQLDREACENLDSMISPCCGDMRELNCGHHQKIAEITDNTGKCLQDEYKVDQPSCLTPRKRSIHLPSVASIEELRTSSLKSRGGAKSPKQPNGDAKHIVASSFYSRDSRAPLTTIN